MAQRRLSAKNNVVVVDGKRPDLDTCSKLKNDT